MSEGVAERVYAYLVERVDQARSAGETVVTFRAGEVRDALGLTGTNAIIGVCQVLETKASLPERAGIEYIDKTGPQAPEGERLARVESHVETLIRGVTEIRADIRDLRAIVDRNFLWMLGIILAMWVTIIAAIIIAILVRQ